MSLIEKLTALGPLGKSGVILLFILGTPLIAALIFEIDWKYGNRQWFYLTTFFSFIGALMTQVFIWRLTEFRLWIKILVSVGSLACAIGLFFVVLYFKTYGGFRGVPAG